MWKVHVRYSANTNLNGSPAHQSVLCKFLICKIKILSSLASHACINEVPSKVIIPQKNKKINKMNKSCPIPWTHRTRRNPRYIKGTQRIIHGCVCMIHHYLVREARKGSHLQCLPLVDDIREHEGHCRPFFHIAWILTSQDLVSQLFKTCSVLIQMV